MRNKNKKRLITKRFLLIVASFLFTSIFLFSNISKVFADETRKGYGWLWGGSDDGAGNVILGWISMNNLNPGTCGASCAIKYGVDIPLTDGTLSGEAWSPSVGWISFKSVDVAGCPESIQANCKAYREGDTIKGWARIVAICDGNNDGKCDSGEVNSNAGGWEGWISLSGSTYGVTIDPTTNDLNGYAWSASSNGNGELGWITFGKAYLGYKLDVLADTTAGGTLNIASDITPVHDFNKIDCTSVYGGASTGTCWSVFNKGTTIKLRATASAGYGVDWGSSPCLAHDDPMSCTVFMDKNYIAPINPISAKTYRTSYTLTVQANETNAKSTAPDTSINCTNGVGVDGGVCTKTYAPGTSITLTAAPLPGNTFSGWTNCTATNGTECNIDLNSDITATATSTIPAVCGNGVKEGTEQCDDGPSGNGACPKTCSNSCTINSCGAPSGGWTEVAP